MLEQIQRPFIFLSLAHHFATIVDKTKVTFLVYNNKHTYRLDANIDYRPTEKGLEMPQIYPGIDVTTRN